MKRSKMSASSLKYSLLLASSSPRRKEILTQLGFSFKVLKPNVREVRLPRETPTSYAKRLSQKKALAVWTALDPAVQQHSLVLAADTVVVLKMRSGKSKLLEKPKNKKEVNAMLRLLSGKSHAVHTAFTVISPEGHHSEIVKSTVEFNRLTEKEIKAYIKSGEPFDKAGGYAVQGIASAFIKKISGSYPNIVGLPTFELIQALKKMKLLKIEILLSKTSAT